MRATWEADGKNNRGNSSATHNNSKDKSFMRKKLHEMVSNSVTRAMKDATSGKKHKKDMECNNIEDDHKSEGLISLSDFNNLSINSNTEE